jgi:hypothetical protein
LTSSAPSGTIYGNAVTFTANVTVTTGGTPGVPPGYIIFFDGATNLGIVPMVNGSASITLANLNAGTHPMRAFYAPSGPNFLSTASPFVNQVVSQATTATTLTSAPVTWMLGQAITFTARVTTTSGGAPGTPTGSVQFNVDGVLTTVPLVNGVATLSQTFTTAGSHTVSAIYLPATAPAQNFQGSAAAPMTQNVKKPTTTTLTSTSNPDDVTLRATVSTSATGGPPTGTVYFYEYLNNAYILLGFSTLVNGVATFSADLAQGNHTIIAFYLGDTNFAASAAVAIVPGKTGGRVV